MDVNDETLKALKDAIDQSPDNIALRKHLIDVLITSTHYKEAEKEIQTALKLSPKEIDLKYSFLL